MPISDCKIIDLPKVCDDRGSLTFLENSNHIPFDIKRIYYLYNIPENKSRGAHGHINLEQLIIAINGKFDITLDDTTSKKSFHLNSPNQGLYVSKGIWRNINNFSENAVCMVLASLPYDENDYIRNYDEFIKFMNK